LHSLIVLYILVQQKTETIFFFIYFFTFYRNWKHWRVRVRYVQSSNYWKYSNPNKRQHWCSWFFLGPHRYQNAWNEWM